VSAAAALSHLFWPAPHLAAAMAEIAALALPAQDAAAPPPLGGRGAAQRDGPDLDFDPVEIPWLDLERALRFLGPGVLTAGEPGVLTAGEPGGGHLALIASGRRWLTVVSPDGRRWRIRPSRLARALRQKAGEGAAAAIDALLAAPQLGALSLTARRRARRALIAAQLAAAPGLHAHLLVTRGGGPAILSSRRSWRRPAAVAAAPFLYGGAALAASILGAQALSSLSWLTLGSAVLAGRFEAAPRAAWALLVLSLPCAHALERAAANALAARAAHRLRRRLFAATLALPPETLRADGAGQLLGRLLAAESHERGLLAGGPAAAAALAELGGAAVALAHGATPTPHIALLIAALAGAALLTLGHASADRAAAASQRALTGHLVEALAGHRTRRAQEPRAAQTAADRARLATHQSRLRRLGPRETLLTAVLPRAWLLAALGTLAAGLAAAAPPPSALALSLGGILLAQGGMGRLAVALRQLTIAWTARAEILPILAAAPAAAAAATSPADDLRGPRDLPDLLVLPPTPAPRTPAPLAPPPLVPPPLTPAHHAPAPAPLLLEARHLTCRLPGAPSPILHDASLAIRPRDRILLTGPSGSGKSTLAALLAAQRAPDSGLLLLDGYDLRTLGARAWRRRVVAVPQLHANHLFAGTLAWNLLLGRAWPPTPRDLTAAGAVCRDLGLGDLVDRLPAGLEQPIGEAGWQLSDGEAARVCLARALLQEPDLLILDESLGALDPGLRLQALAAIGRRARAVLLIAHPDHP
jgi:ATP-binding cassette subfamily B protein